MDGAFGRVNNGTGAPESGGCRGCSPQMRTRLRPKPWRASPGSADVFRAVQGRNQMENLQAKTFGYSYG